MFPNQSKTVNLLQLSVPQVPLFLHPLGVPSLAPVEQLVQAIIYSDVALKQLKFLKRLIGKDSIFIKYIPT
jgi:hypothetical protein